MNTPPVLAQYLAAAGIRHIFGQPGNHRSNFWKPRVLKDVPFGGGEGHEAWLLSSDSR